MNKRKAWTAAEDKKLIELRLAGMTWQQVAQELDRTEAAIMARVAKLIAKERRENETASQFP